MLVKVMGAFVAIFAFAVLLETPKRYLWCAGVVGAVGWFSYLLSGKLGAEELMAIFLSALTISVVSHVFARLFKMPVTVFLIPGILPTVPGAGMYRIVYYILEGNKAMTSHYFLVTLETAGAIAIAIFLVDSFFRIFWRDKHEKGLTKE